MTQSKVTRALAISAIFLCCIIGCRGGWSERRLSDNFVIQYPRKDWGHLIFSSEATNWEPLTIIPVYVSQAHNDGNFIYGEGVLYADTVIEDAHVPTLYGACSFEINETDRQIVIRRIPDGDLEALPQDFEASMRSENIAEVYSLSDSSKVTGFSYKIIQH